VDRGHEGEGDAAARGFDEETPYVRGLAAGGFREAEDEVERALTVAEFCDGLATDEGGDLLADMDWGDAVGSCAGAVDRDAELGDGDLGFEGDIREAGDHAGEVPDFGSLGAEHLEFRP